MADAPRFEIDEDRERDIRAMLADYDPLNVEAQRYLLAALDAARAAYERLKNLVAAEPRGCGCRGCVLGEAEKLSQHARELEATGQGLQAISYAGWALEVQRIAHTLPQPAGCGCRAIVEQYKHACAEAAKGYDDDNPEHERLLVARDYLQLVADKMPATLPLPAVPTAPHRVRSE